jgi:peptidoglycan/xylan/chitin deacetylase (PgdA/CDA1 family)
MRIATLRANRCPPSGAHSIGWLPQWLRGAMVVAEAGSSPREEPVGEMWMYGRAPRTSTMLAVAALAAMAGLAGCGSAPPAAPAAPAPPSAQAPPPPGEVGADELGHIPVLMYHRIVAEAVSVYDRTPADFRAELERLAAENYVPITAADLAAGRIDVPAGAHPVVLTFDDGAPSQFALGPDGRPTPDSAIGILLDVAAAHPGFRPVATLYVNAEPFGEPGGTTTLPWLHAHGFEIGLHTASHTNLSAASAEEVQSDIVDNLTMIRQAVPEAAVTTIALPFGAHPESEELALHGASGGTTYDLAAAMLVGADPAPSPYSTGFDPENIPRIRSQAATGADAQYVSATWLDRLASGEVSRYTSDGDPAHVSFPARRATALGTAFGSAAQRY